MGSTEITSDLYFLGLGPQKTATTWLYAALAGSPQVCFPRGVKETFFWDRHFDRGLDWYLSHYRRCQPETKLGEIAPTLFEAPDCPHRISQHYPGCRLVVTLRDPAERVFSLYLHHCRKGRIQSGFAQALADHPWLMEGSRYGKHLENWLAFFPKDQIQVLLLEEIREAPRESLERVQKFLGLEELVPQNPERAVNQASLPRFPQLARWLTRGADGLRGAGLYWPVEFAKRMGLKVFYQGVRDIPKLPAEQRRELVPEFEEGIAFVEQWIGRDLPHWRQREDA